MEQQNLKYDVIVIGGGVVGCAMVRKFTLQGASVLLLEKGDDILSGASKANSAILHTGFDAPPGSLEVQCMQAGYQEYLSIYQKFGLPLLETGAHVVAWDQEQLQALDNIVSKAHTNGVLDVRKIGSGELYEKEPDLAEGALAAVSVPGEFVIDPWSSPLAYLTQAVSHGADYRFLCEVTNVSRDQGRWQVHCGQETFLTDFVVNCAGSHGDLLDGLWRRPDFTIKPRKGQFVVLDKAASGIVNSIILPVPTATTKGVLLSKTIFGNLLLGPTAEEQDDRNIAEVCETQLEKLLDQGKRLAPKVSDFPVTATYAGLRPATTEKDYQIFHYTNDNWISVGGIRSTGLTAALGIAEHVFREFQKNYSATYQPIAEKDLIWPQMPMLSHYHQRDYQKENNGGIVCHCEWVTRREIENVIHSLIPPEGVGGVRRRTRAMMGRCNGFYCSNAVAEIVDETLSNKIAVGTLS